jgi:hypothetical protein
MTRARVFMSVEVHVVCMCMCMCTFWWLGLHCVVSRHIRGSLSCLTSLCGVPLSLPLSLLPQECVVSSLCHGQQVPQGLEDLTLLGQILEYVRRSVWCTRCPAAAVSHWPVRWLPSTVLPSL